MHNNDTNRPRPRRLRRAVVSALAAVAAVAAIGPASASASQHDTFSTFYYGPGTVKFLLGQIQSEKKVCQKRTAYIHKSGDQVNWLPFDVFQTDRSGGFARQIQQADTGKYYRLVVPKRVINLPDGRRIVCRAHTSESVYAGQ